jgi:hypothetical protein
MLGKQGAMSQPNSSGRIRAPRTAVLLPASIRERGRARAPGRLIDISRGGCRIEYYFAGLQPGCWVWLSVSGLATQYCRVAWCCDAFAGLEFAAPLEEAVVERLAAEGSSDDLGTVRALRDTSARCRDLEGASTAGFAAELASLGRDCEKYALVARLRRSWG